MIDGVEGLYEVEVGQSDCAPFVHQTDYTHFLKEEVGQAWSEGKEAMLDEQGHPTGCRRMRPYVGGALTPQSKVWRAL